MKGVGSAKGIGAQSIGFLEIILFRSFWAANSSAHCLAWKRWQGEGQKEQSGGDEVGWGNQKS